MTSLHQGIPCRERLQFLRQTGKHTAQNEITNGATMDVNSQFMLNVKTRISIKNYVSPAYDIESKDGFIGK